jgi:drug/metabolite transporter (DMT)-like permease
MARTFLIIGSFAAIYLLWGSTYFAIALGLQSMPPLMLMGVRSLCGGLILIGLGGRGALGSSGRTWLNAGLCGLLFFVGCHGILAVAQQRVPSGIAAIVLATIPFWIVLIDFLVPHDARPEPRTLIALIPGFAGVAIVAWQNVSRNGVGMLPMLLLLIAALSWSAGTALSRRTSNGGSSLSISGMQLSLGGIVLFLISWLSGEMRHFAPSAVSIVSLEAAIYLIVAGSVVGFAAYHWLLDNVPTPLVSTYTFVNPVIAVLLGTVFLGEPLSAAMFFGGCLVIASIVAMWGIEHSSSRSAAREKPRPVKQPSMQRAS